MWGLGGVVVLGDRGLKGLALGLKTNSLALGLSLECVTEELIFSISSCGLPISATMTCWLGWCGGWGAA